MNGLIKGGVLFAAAGLLALGCGVGTDENGDDLAAVSDELGKGKGKGGNGGQGTTTVICHIPPGNPANRHTITVGTPAVWAHVSRHGDTIGPCDADAGVEVDAGTEVPDAGDPDAGTVDPDGGIN